LQTPGKRPCLKTHGQGKKSIREKQKKTIERRKSFLGYPGGTEVWRQNFRGKGKTLKGKTAANQILNVQRKSLLFCKGPGAWEGLSKWKGEKKTIAHKRPHITNIRENVGVKAAFRPRANIGCRGVAGEESKEITP